jgi:hypothetical protein
MVFVKDIAIPLILAALSIGLISYLINVILRFIKLDLVIIKIALFLLVWYFVGPVIYNWLLYAIMTSSNEIIEFFYMPIQVVMRLLNV